jgi:pyrimidine operon attenuation protein/uracil phosphoribosyltransferase
MDGAIMSSKALIMDESGISRAITRIAHEILEKNKGADNLALIGIQRRGVPIAKMISEKIAEVEGRKIPVGILDITFYRDDLSLLAEHPVVKGTYIDFQINGLKIVLVDDVLYTGRTVRAAIDALMDIGRPQMIQLAILIDRGHRELPIRADYIGKNVPTSRNEVIHVKLKCIDDVDADFVEIRQISDE